MPKSKTKLLRKASSDFKRFFEPTIFSKKLNEDTYLIKIQYNKYANFESKAIINKSKTAFGIA